MKKRIIALAMATIMALTMIACGKEEVTNTSNEANTTVESTTDVVETEPTNVVEETTEPTDTVETVTPETEPVEEVFVFDLEYGMAKVNRLMEAYDTLMSQDKLFEDHLQLYTESLTGNKFNFGEFTTADGKVMQTGRQVYATTIIYYNNYVNNNMEYYDLTDWFSEQENEVSILSMIPNFESVEEYTTYDTLLLEAISLLAYMDNCETIEGKEVVEYTDWTVSGIQTAYSIILVCDGEEMLEAVFDTEGHLLNIWPAIENFNYVSSFPNGDMGADAE